MSLSTTPELADGSRVARRGELVLRRPRADPSNGAVRPGTTIVLVGLLVMIFAAALIQFVFLAR